MFRNGENLPFKNVDFFFSLIVCFYGSICAVGVDLFFTFFHKKKLCSIKTAGLNRKYTANKHN